MTYVPVIMNADNRSARGMAPLKLTNWFVEPISGDNQKQARAVLLPTPGLVERLDMGATIQGVWQEDGVRNGNLFVVAGSKLYSVSSSWAKTEIGSLDAGEAEFAGLRDTLFTAVNTRLWKWDGSALSEVTDVDLPNVSTLIVLGQRILLHSDGTDTLTWSQTLDGTSIEALAFSTAEQSPDAIRRIMKIGGQAIVFGTSGIEVFRSVPSTALPFQNVANQALEESSGLLGKYAAAKRGDKVFFVGGNLACYVMYGMGVDPLPPNTALKDVLLSLTQAQREATTTWAYSDGNHEFFVVRPPGKPAHVFNQATQLWSERETYGLGYYAPKYHTRAYGHDVVAYEGGSKIYTMSRDLYSDAGTPVVRTATLRFNGSQREAIGSFCVDAATFDHPQTGQGSAPKMMVSFSDNARVAPDASRSSVHLDIPPVGRYYKPTIWGVGVMTPSEGMLVHLSVSDPLGVALYGAWVNEGQVS